MSELETSFKLLSTMSPKVTRARKSKKNNKSPFKLSLKKHFRKSAAFDKKTHCDLDSSVIIINDSYEDKEKSFSTTKIKVKNPPFIISASSETASDTDLSSRVQEKLKNKTNSAVDKWLSDNEKTDNSEVFSFKHNSYINSDDEICKTKNTQDVLGNNLDLKYNNVNNKIDVFDLLKEQGDVNNRPWKIVEISSKTVTDPFLTPNKNYSSTSENTPSIPTRADKENHELNNSFDDHIEDYESILDDLYGKSWRDKKDQILPKSEKRPPKPSIHIQHAQTERKPNKNRNNLKFNKKVPVTPIQLRLNGLCDSDSDESDTSSESYKSLKNKHLNFSDSEDERPIQKSPISKPLPKKKDLSNVKRRSPKKYSQSSSNSSNSSEINFSDSENDSLGTRVRKKLAKKAKDLREFASTPKSKLNLNEIKNKKEANINNKKTKKKTDVSTKVNKKTEVKQKSTKTVMNTQEEKVEENTKFSFLYSLSDCLPSWQSDPQARFYRDNYKTHKEILLKKLFDLYNEKIFDNAIPKDTPIEWNDRIRQTAGFCYNRRITRRTGVVERHCRIVLAPKILDKAYRLRDTLVHEMCHAATWIVNKIADGHGSYWKAWAQKAMATFPELPPIKRCHDYVINTKYTYKCVDCGYSIGRHSKSLDIERKRCGYCHGKFEIFINKTTKAGETKVTPATPKGKATGFALFVKENYSLVKKQDMKHAEVMKLLGQKFSAMKVAKN